MAVPFTREQRIFLKTETDKLEYGDGYKEIADKFNELYPDRVPPMKGHSISKHKSNVKIFMETGKTFEEYLDQYEQTTRERRPFLAREEAWLTMYTHLREDSLELAKQYNLKFETQRTPDGLMKKIQELNGKGNNTTQVGYNTKDDISHHLGKLHPSLIFIDEDITKGYAAWYAVMCKKEGHITMKMIPSLNTGCGTCSNFGRHEDPLEPGIYYVVDLLDSTLNDFKPGITLERVGIATRAKRYGRYEILNEVHKPIGELEIFEKEMKKKYENWRTFNPMLYKNGTGECLHKEILPELQKDIKNYESR